MRLGMLGGSFDPVHTGHLILAESARDAAGLDRVNLVVAGRPPHKTDRRLAPAPDRLEMARRAVADHPALEIDDRELRRGGPSFTIDTVREVRAETGAAAELFWIIGADSLPDLPSWHDATALLDEVRILTGFRPGHDVRAALRALEGRFGRECAVRLEAGLVEMPLVSVSSTDIRRRVAEGRSIRYLVPEPVRDHIERRGLYRPLDGRSAPR